MINDLKEKIKQESESPEQNNIDNEYEPGQVDNLEKMEIDPEGSDDSEEQEEEASTEEEVAEEESAEEETGADPKDVKKLRKRIEGNYRKKLKEKDVEMQEMKEALKRMELQIAEQRGFQEALRKPENIEEVKEEDIEPDPVLDPEEHVNWKLRQIEKKNEELIANQAKYDNFMKEKETQDAISSLEENYRRNNPNIDYDSAKKYLKDQEKLVLKIQYPNASDADIDKHLNSIEREIFINMAAQGKDATESFVEMAKQRGFEPTVGESRRKGPNLKKLKENQSKSASLIGGTDAVKEHGVTPDQLVNMSMDQFYSMDTKDLFKRAHKSLMK